MSQKPDEANPFDPFGTWRGMRDTYMDAMSKAMIDTVNSEPYSQAMSAMLDTWLSASVPLQQSVEQTMTQVLGQLNMPSRSDITSLAERLTNIEMRLDDLDAKLDALQSGKKTSSPSGKKKE